MAQVPRKDLIAHIERLEQEVAYEKRNKIMRGRVACRHAQKKTKLWYTQS